MKKELIAEIVIPNYVRTYIKSKGLKAKYYEQGKKKIPVPFCDKALYKASKTREPDNIIVEWREIPVLRNKVKCSVNFLVFCDSGERVIANKDQIGKQKIGVINGQSFFNAKLFRHEIGILMGVIKDQMRAQVIPLQSLRKDQLPIIIEVDLYDQIYDSISKEMLWDAGNRILPYNKAFEDILQDCGILPNDNILHVTGAPATVFTPIEEGEERKLVYRVYSDRRDIILNNKIYQDLHGYRTTSN